MNVSKTVSSIKDVIYNDEVNILVLGEDNRSCLSVVRSLGRKGMTVALGSLDPQSIVRRSKYVRKVFLLPDTRTEVGPFLSELKRLLQQNRFDLIIPCSDKTMVPLIQNRNEMEELGKFALPDDVAFLYSYCKDKTIELARELHVPAPHTYVIAAPSDLDNFDATRVDYPLVAKPASSKVWHRGMRFDMRVKKVNTPDELRETVRDMLYKCPVLVQNYFPGIGVGQEFLVNDGKILLKFQHLRVHEPSQGGGSSYRKSVPINEKMHHFSEKILSRLRWTGAVMIEYRENPQTGEFALMEINGRFWGSLPLAIASGVDFPYELCSLFIEKKQILAQEYRIGLYSRNLQKDLSWFKQIFKSCLRNPSQFGKLFNELGSGMAHVVTGCERWDEFTLDDPIPGFAQMLQGTLKFGKKLFFEFPNRLQRSVQSRFAGLKYRDNLRKMIDQNRKLLFICRGNICRSPFAEAYFRSSWNGGLKPIDVISAGTYPIDQRESPATARQVAHALNLNLDSHRSRIVNEDLMNESGAVFCMDARDYEELITQFPRSKFKLFYLGSFNKKNRKPEIADPWGKSYQEFKECYLKIMLSIDGLIEVLEK